MSDKPKKSYVDRFISGSFGVLLAAIALSLSWQLLLPLLPFLVGLAGITGVMAIIRWRRSYW